MKRREAISIGVDLGGTKIHVVILDEKNEVLGSARNPSLGHAGAEKGLETIERTVREALEAAKAVDREVLALGIGCPGVVDLERGILKIAPNLGWTDVPVGKFLGKAFDCPVTVLNDVDAGTYGEFVFGAGRKATSLLGVFPGTGLGGGFIYRGQILHGRRYSCMEISDLRIGGATLLRPGNEWPTLEDLTSRLAITSAVAVEAYRGHVPSLVDVPLSQIKSKSLEKCVKAGEQAVIDILEKSIQVLGTGLASLVSVLGPDRIVLGGGLVERFQDRYVKGLTKQIKAQAPAELVEELKVVCAELGDDATAKGAGAYATVQAGE